MSLHVARGHVIVEFESQDEEGTGWIEDEDAEAWLPALLPLRAELARGDLARSIWGGRRLSAAGGSRTTRTSAMSCWQTTRASKRLLADDEVEPPVPGAGHSLPGTADARAVPAGGRRPDRRRRGAEWRASSAANPRRT